MGFKDWFNAGISVSVRTSRSSGVTPIAIPEGRQAPVDLIETMLAHAADLGGRWQASFAADGHSVQVAGDHVYTPEPVDLPDLARRLGLTALADQIRAGGRSGDDRTLHRVPDAAPGEIAALVDALFRLHYGLPEGYSFRASATCV
jgi:hypothetical protein